MTNNNRAGSFLLVSLQSICAANFSKLKAALVPLFILCCKLDVRPDKWDGWMISTLIEKRALMSPSDPLYMYIYLRFEPSLGCSSLNRIRSLN